MVFGCQRFYKFLFGKEFIIETDHKPLEAIFRKLLDKCPLRLQRLRISVQNYIPLRLNINLDRNCISQIHYLERILRIKMLM